MAWIWEFDAAQHLDENHSKQTLPCTCAKKKLRFHSTVILRVTALWETGAKPCKVVKKTRINSLPPYSRFELIAFFFLPYRFQSFSIQANLERFTHTPQQSRNHVWSLFCYNVFGASFLGSTSMVCQWALVFKERFSGWFCYRFLLSIYYRFAVIHRNTQQNKWLARIKSHANKI